MSEYCCFHVILSSIFSVALLPLSNIAGEFLIQSHFSTLVLSGSTKSARGLQNQRCRLVSAVSEQTTLLLKALGVKYSALGRYPSNLCSVCVAVVVVVVEIHFV